MRMFNHCTLYFLISVYTVLFLASFAFGKKNSGSESNNVWPIAPLKHGEVSFDSKRPVSSTEDWYSLSCVPTVEGRNQCAEIAKEVGAEYLHYVELLRARTLLGSFCTSDLASLPRHIKHVCTYQYCSGESCTQLHVFDINESKVPSQGNGQYCRTTAIRSSDVGPVVHKVSSCGGRWFNSKVMQECLSHRGYNFIWKRFARPHEKPWKLQENIDSICGTIQK